VEVALGVQFRPLFGLRPIELGGLRERWRPRYPLVQEQPPLPPAIEGQDGASAVQFVVGPALQTRLWFLDEDQAELVQLQHDRLTVNWRQTQPGAAYPRYPRVRSVFRERFDELRSFAEESGIGAIDITQVEVSYINAVDPGGAGGLNQILRAWTPTAEHHLGEPEQARATLVFAVAGLGRPPARLYVTIDPGQRPGGGPVTFLTLSVRGAPTGPQLDPALEFMDQAHDHVVHSFVELTPEVMHNSWQRLR